jgi:glycerophosphoryl diester phosphodiesterase
MKRFIKLSVIACLVAVMSGCNDNDEEASYFKIGSQSLTQVFGPEGGTGYFTVSANRKFTAAASESWCTATVMEGKTEENIEIKVSPLQAITGRQATVTIACAGFASQSLTVTQTGVTVTFEVTPPENRTAVAWQGENVVFTVNSSETWAYEITAGSGWLAEETKGAATLTLVAAANSGDARDAAVRFFLPAYPDAGEEIEITQAARAVTLSVAPEAVSLTKNGGGIELTVTTNADSWTYTKPAWSRLTEKTGASLKLTVDANMSISKRTGFVVVTAGGQVQQTTVAQAGLVDFSGLTPPVAIGHRGMFQTYPENTLSALRACVENGMGVEFDVRTSKDGELVIMHDDNTARTTNGGFRKIRDLTLAEIKELDAGSWFNPSFAGERVPTLEEVLSTVKEKQIKAVPLAVNIKDVDVSGEIELVNLLVKYNLLEQSFCFDQTEAASRRLKNLNVSVKTGRNVGRGDLQKEITEGLTDVFLIGFTPAASEASLLKQANKLIVANLGGQNISPDLNHDYLITSGIDGLLVDNVWEFHRHINDLFTRNEN